MSDSTDDPRLALLLIGAIVSGALFGAAIVSGASFGPDSTESDQPPAIRDVEVQQDHMLISVGADQVRNLTVVYPNGSEMRPFTTLGGAQVFAAPEAGRRNVDGNTTFTLLARDSRNEIVETRDVRVVAPSKGDNDFDLND